MPERVTYFVAAPIARRDDGAVLCDDAVQCDGPEAAIETARQMALSPFYVGAWAFSRTGYPSLGWSEMQKSCADLAASDQAPIFHRIGSWLADVPSRRYDLRKAPAAARCRGFFEGCPYAPPMVREPLLWFRSRTIVATQVAA